MIKLIVTLLAIASISNARVVNKRFLSGSISVGGITIPTTGTLDLSSIQNTFGVSTGSFDNSLTSLLGGTLNQADFITQLTSTLNTLSTQFPFQILSNGLINLPLGACTVGSFIPTADLSSNCVSRIFPQISECSNAINNPSLQSLLTCGRLLQSISSGAQACIALVSSPTEQNFVGCATMVANMLTPNADALLSIYQQCRPLGTTADYKTVSSCAFEIINSVNTIAGTIPVLSQISNLQSIANCIDATVESPTTILQSCQSALSLVLQNLNVSPLVSQLLQCKVNGGSVSLCAGKLIEASKLF